jgi:beta-mannosidase
VRCHLSLGGKDVAQFEGSGVLEWTVEQPQLWWPNGLGEQPLYVLTIELVLNGHVLDSYRHRIGLRTIVLDRHDDQWGESFRFV